MRKIPYLIDVAGGGEAGDDVVRAGLVCVGEEGTGGSAGGGGKRQRLEADSASAFFFEIGHLIPTKLIAPVPELKFSGL